MLHILEQEGTDITWAERIHEHDPVVGISGPVVADYCDKICGDCRKHVWNGAVPKHALSNGFWIGNVPDILKDLSFAKQLIISRVQHFNCFVRVGSGSCKMISHAVAFESPTPKIYDFLLPPVEELDDVLAIMFTGPKEPAKSDYKRTPPLVRHNVVVNALSWLKLNHCDYVDVGISLENLEGYPEDMPPVSIQYKYMESNKPPEATSTFDNEVEDGNEEGICPFIVHGLFGQDLETQTTEELKVIALQYYENNGKFLSIGQSNKPQSIYNNPTLYPAMFPWLFPYGLGGISGSTVKISFSAHKKQLLMYYDKCFQKDPMFPFVCFSHEQIKESTTGSFLLADKEKFFDITNRILDIDQNVLSDLSKRMSKGVMVRPKTQQEKDCFQVIRDLDHVGGKVQGLLTSKKYMRHELNAIMTSEGAPSWYITFAPSDQTHPISLYWADTKETFFPDLRIRDDRLELIADNPVVGACFFNFMTNLFIKHVLGFGSDLPGAFGEASSYYGTVEQQGHLTLHLHLLLWLCNALSPQEICDRIMNTESPFLKELIAYLESIHQGEYFNGTQSEILQSIAQDTQQPGFKSPIEVLPESPPEPCPHLNCTVIACEFCSSSKSWWDFFYHTVDFVVGKTHIHDWG